MLIDLCYASPFRLEGELVDGIPRGDKRMPKGRALSLVSISHCRAVGAYFYIIYSASKYRRIGVN